MKNSLNILLVVTFIVLLAGCLEQKENLETPLIPNIIIGVDSYSPPAYRGNLTIVNLIISGINVTKETEISLSYKTEVLRTDGSLESKPKDVYLIPDQKMLIFQRIVKAGEPPEKLYSNLTINVDKPAVDGEYYITVSGKDKGLDFGSAVLSFKIGKGGKLPQAKKDVWNIGYTRDQPPPLSEEEKAQALAIASNTSYLKGKRYEIVAVNSNFYDMENFSGFFPVITVDMEEQIVSYIIDMEEKKVLPYPIFAIKTKVPNIGIFTSDYESSGSNPNHPSIGRGKSTLINLTIQSSNLSNGTMLHLNYSIYARYPDGSTEKNPKGVDLFIEPDVVIFKDCIGRCYLHSNLTVKVSPIAKQGIYQLYFEGRATEEEVSSQVFQFALGK